MRPRQRACGPRAVRSRDPRARRAAPPQACPDERLAGTMSRQGRKMRKLPRSLHFYVAASTFYAALVFFVVQYIYTIQLAESGLFVAWPDTEDILALIQFGAFVVWHGLSLIASFVLTRLLP